MRHMFCLFCVRYGEDWDTRNYETGEDVATPSLGKMIVIVIDTAIIAHTQYNAKVILLVSMSISLFLCYLLRSSTWLEAFLPS
jgi:hypothetical protein